MESHIKRIDKEVPLPEYKTTGAAGFDLSARIEVIIVAKSVGYIPLNVTIKPPEGHFTLLVPRSSLHKLGLIPVNGVGIVDADYCGDEDEYKAALYNFSESDVTITKGERIMQGVFTPLTRAQFIEVNEMGEPSRGGFGSTGQV